MIKLTYEELLLKLPIRGTGDIIEVNNALDSLIEDNVVTRVLENGMVYYYISEENALVAHKLGLVE